MKILYVSSSIIPSRNANSVHVMKMCRAFVSGGHEVTLAARKDRKNSEAGVRDVFGFYGVGRTFSLLRLPWPPVKFGGSLLYSSLAAAEAFRLKPDLVYCRNVPAAFLSAHAGLDVALESHQPLEGSSSPRLTAWMLRKLACCRRLLKLVVITASLADYYEKKFPDFKGKVFVAPDGADPVPDRVFAKCTFKSRKRLKAGYVGHLYNGRGIDIILKLAKLCQWAEFHIVGGADADIMRWKKKVAIGNNVHFHGFVPPAHVQSKCCAFDILLAPYQHVVPVAGGGNTASWMSPLKIFEYMASGKAIIASDLPVLREILEDGRNCILCRPDDINDWKQALERLRGRAKLRNCLGRAAQKDFLDRYTWNARAGKVLE